MILQNTIEIKIQSKRQMTMYSKKFNIICKIGDVLNLDWRPLIKSSYRKEKILVQCDECLNEFKIPIQRIKNEKLILCKSCNKRGSRNPMYGTTINNSPGTKRLQEIRNAPNYINPWSRNEVIKKMKNLPNRTKHLHNNKHAAGKRSIEAKHNISIGVNKGYINGTRNKNHGNAKQGTYKNIKYQGGYELDFLERMDEYGILHLIQRGPTIKYLDEHSKFRYYLSDYTIIGTNVVIEIKSTHFWKLNEKNNLCKMKESQKHYEYYLILDKDYNEFIMAISVILQFM